MDGAAIHPISQVTQLARVPPPYSLLFAAVHLADEAEASGETHAECIGTWEGRPGYGEKEVESPAWGKVVE